MQEFTFSADPDQKFSAVMNGKRTTLRFWWNHLNDRWSFDLYLDDAPVLNARRVVGGVDLLEPFGFDLGKLFAWAPGGDAPDRFALSDGRVRLIHMTDTEFEGLVNASVSPQS